MEGLFNEVADQLLEILDDTARISAQIQDEGLITSRAIDSFAEADVHVVEARYFPEEILVSNPALDMTPGIARAVERAGVELSEFAAAQLAQRRRIRPQGKIGKTLIRRSHFELQ